MDWIIYATGFVVGLVWGIVISRKQQQKLYDDDGN
jgi:uncharacterized membrane-anchored protein YhcB (DUF1043 family)